MIKYSDNNPPKWVHHHRDMLIKFVISSIKNRNILMKFVLAFISSPTCLKLSKMFQKRIYCKMLNWFGFIYLLSCLCNCYETYSLIYFAFPQFVFELKQMFKYLLIERFKKYENYFQNFTKICSKSINQFNLDFLFDSIDSIIQSQFKIQL